MHLVLHSHVVNKPNALNREEGAKLFISSSDLVCVGYNYRFISKTLVYSLC